MKYQIFLLLVGISFSNAWACGTVESRAGNYLSSNSLDHKLLELTYLNCEPVLKSYSNDPLQDHLLADVLLDAFYISAQLKKSDPDASEKFNTLAIATFFRFEGLKNQEGAPKHNLLVQKMAFALGLNMHEWDEKWEGQRFVVFQKFAYPFNPSNFYAISSSKLENIFFE